MTPPRRQRPARDRPSLWPLLPIYGLAVFLGIVAVAAVVIGIHDASVSRTSLGVTLSAAVLLAFAVILGAAVLDLWRLAHRGTWPYGRRPPCRPVVLIAFLATILVGIYVLLSTIRVSSDQRPVVVLVALLLVLLAFVGLHYFSRDARVTLPRVGAIVLGLIGTIVGAWEFWFQNQYVPSHAGRSVELAVKLERAGLQGDDAVIRATVDYQDVGKSVLVIGSTYTLTGSRLVRCEREATPERVASFLNSFLLDPQRSRFMSDVLELQPAKVLAAGKFVGDGKRLDPDVAASRTVLFLVPKRRYQLLRFRAQLFAIPASIELSQRRLPEYKTYNGDHDLYALWRVDDDSWLHDLVSGRERWVVLRYALVSSPEKSAISPDLRVTAVFPKPRWTEGKPSAAYVKRLFAQPSDPLLNTHPLQDASEPFADSELILNKAAKAIAGPGVPRVCTGG